MQNLVHHDVYYNRLKSISASTALPDYCSVLNDTYQYLPAFYLHAEPGTIKKRIPIVIYTNSAIFYTFHTFSVLFGDRILTAP